MPQDGSNNYYYPPGTPGIPDQTIESEAYNTFLNDLVNNDLNIPRPVHRGGTGATVADEGLVNLASEKATQVVTNFDSHVWLPGSFRSSNVTGQAAPVDGHAFAGICYLNEPFVYPPTNQNLIVEARDENDTVVPGRVYVRQKKAGVWDPSWVEQVGGSLELLALADARYVDVAGDTMTGALTLAADPVAALEAVTKQYVDARIIPPVVGKTANYTIAAADHGTTFICGGSGVVTLGLDAAATLGAGFTFTVKSTGTFFGTIIDPGASELIDDKTTLLVPAKASCTVVCTGTTFQSIGYGADILIDSGTFSAGSLPLLLPPGYAKITVDIPRLEVSASGGTLNMRVSQNQGSSFLAADYRYVFGYSLQNSTAGGAGAAAQAEISFIGGSASTGGYNHPVRAEVNDPDSSGVLKPIFFQTSYRRSTDDLVQNNIGSGVYVGNSDPISAITFFGTHAITGNYVVTGRRRQT